MRIGVPRERKSGERRVGLPPTAVAELSDAGHTVVVEQGAGLGSFFDDASYESAGATIVDCRQTWDSELIIKVKEPVDKEWERLGPGQTLFTFLHLAADSELEARLLASGATAIAYELVTSPVGAFPILAPMSEIAGRLAGQAAAQYLLASSGGRGVLPGSVGGVPAAQVVVIGGGVVGAAAASIVAALGADVTVFERNLDRIRSLSWKLGDKVSVRFSNNEDVEALCATADAVVGAVLVPGARPPQVLSRSAVQAMKPSAALIDVAIDQGGCFATSRPTTHEDPTYLFEEVIHYCVANMPAAVPRTATFALAHASLGYVRLLAEGVERALAVNPDLAKAVVIKPEMVEQAPA